MQDYPLPTCADPDWALDEASLKAVGRFLTAGQGTSGGKARRQAKPWWWLGSQIPNLGPLSSVCICMYMSVYVCVCMCLCIYVRMHACIHVHIGSFLA